MRELAHALVLSLALLGVTTGSSLAADPPVVATAQPDTQRQRIIVAFANEPRRAPAAAGSTGRRYSGDGYLLAQGAHSQAKRVASTYSLKEVASWPIKALSVHCVVYEIPDGRPMASVLAQLAKDSQVTLAQPLQEFHTLTDSQRGDSTTGQSSTGQSSPPGKTFPGKTLTGQAPYNDPLYDLQTNLAALGISAAHERSQGSGVRIALIDTGVDTAHPDLSGRIASTQSFVDPRPTSTRAYRHGTAMAGLIGAVANNRVGIVGIAPRAEIAVFEACWQLKPDADAAACNTFTLAEALAAALDSGAQLVNLSIAGPADPLLSALIEAGLRHGVTFVGALAGPSDVFPTGIPGVIAVSGSDRTPRERAPNVVAAPAEHVLTLRPEAQYDFESGTSVAAAEITGVIALLMSAAENRLTTDTIVALLRETSPTREVSPFVDVNAALTQLDLNQHRGRVAARGSAR